LTSRRVRVARIGILAAAVAALVVYVRGEPPIPERCERYDNVDQPLIAHAGGGLPRGTYTNSLEAVELAARHGFKLIELDFVGSGNRLSFGHDPEHSSAMTLEQLLDFMRRNRGVSIVTDFKSGNNLAGLKLLAERAGPLKARFIPQIYRLSEIAPVAALGFPKPILTVYREPDFGWQFRVNDQPLRALTMPYRLRYLAAFVDHPVYLHTVNEPAPGYGLYTDCLIPAD
jgi:hypothetical protein